MNLERAAKALGLLAGLATLVYISGGFVLALRLAFEDLPWESVISQLPREFLISIGITIVVIPILAAATAYIAWRLSRGRDSFPRTLNTGEALLSAAVIAAVLVVPGGLIEYDKDGWRPELPIWLAVAWFISFLWTYTMLRGRAAYASRHANPPGSNTAGPSWNSISTVLTMSMLYAALLLPGAIVVGVTLPMTDASACGQAGTQISGRLVGDTSDRLYIGQKPPEHSEPLHIISVPYSKLAEVYIGRDAADETCEEAFRTPADP